MNFKEIHLQNSNIRYDFFKLIIMLVFLVMQANCDSCAFNADGTALLNTYHEMYINASCYPCLNQCKLCDNLTDTTCQGGNCEDFYYFDSFSSKCLQCSSQCRNCQGPNESDCEVCVEGYYFDSTSKLCKICPYGAEYCSGMIVYSCMPAYFLDSQSSSCRKCGSNCLNCTSLSSCTLCASGYFVDQNNVCQKCQINNCSKCYNITNCYQCQSGFSLNNSGLCVINTCSQGSCLACSSSNQSSCIECKAGYFLFASKCYFGSSILCSSGNNGSSYGKCNSCNSNISFTNANNPSYCLLSQPSIMDYGYEFINYPSIFLCRSPQYLTQQGSTLVQIPITMQPTFQMDFEIRMISQIINSSMIQIKLSSTTGQQISFTEITDNLSLLSDTFYCKDKGSVNNTELLFVYRITKSFYINSSQNSTVLTISDSSNVSLIYLSEILITSHYCLTDNCLSCYSSNLCSSCQNNYFLEEYECKINCSDGYYTNFYEKNCVQQCDSGFYLIFETSVCEKCPTSCSICVNSSYCTNCASGFFLYQNGCLNKCPNNHTYADSGSNECKICKNPCKTCLSAGDNCTSCLQGYLFQNKCVTSCPSTYFQNFANSTAICSACSVNCENCSISSDFCSSCSSNQSLYSGQCYNQCPDGYYTYLTPLSGNLCLPCLSSCKSCFGTDYNCTSCMIGFLLQMSYTDYLSISNLISDEQTKAIGDLFLIQFGFTNSSNLNQTTLNNSIAGVCLSTCPELLFYEDQINKLCIKCDSKCLRCQNLSNCIECQAGYFLENGVCVKSCSSATSYMNNLTKKCESCKMPCKQCITDYNGTNCISCLDGYFEYLQNTSIQCLLRCPVGYYKNTTTKSQCQACPSNCTSCLTSQICTQCKSTYYLSVDNQCLQMQSCSIGYFFDSSVGGCSQCLISCLSCSNFSYMCTQCYDSTLNLLIKTGLCVEECPAEYYSTTVNRSSLPNLKPDVNRSSILICQQCNINCSSCTSANNCTKCQDQFIFLSGSCLSSCPLSYFQQYTTDGRICSPCISNCLNCLSQSYCLQCQPNYVLLSNQCYDTCIDGYYLNLSVSNNQTINQCLKCPDQCEKCTASDNCTSCNFGYFLSYNATSQNSQCGISCQFGFYPDQIARTCEACQYPCNSCSNSIVCLSCQGNLTLINQDCINECPSQYYLKTITNSTNFICLPCLFPCKTCTTDLLCIQCSTGYYFYSQNSSCITNCPDQLYGNILTGNCESCEMPCKTCENNSNTCKSCIQGYSLRNNLCLSNCPTGTYLSTNGTITSCENCNSTCKQCSSLNYCTQCQYGYFLYQQSSQSQFCLSNCPTGFYSSQTSKTCEQCYSKCKTCSKDKFTCLSCFDEQFLLRNGCVQQCPVFYFTDFNNSTCSQCGKWCQSCVNYSKCLKCSSGFLYNGQCLSICPERYYGNQQTLTCDKCMQGCIICKNDKVCQKCSKAENFILFQATCIANNCPDGYYELMDENECVQSCNYLVNEVQKRCYLSKCPDYLILSSDKSQCLFTCPQNYFVVYSYSNDTIQCASQSALTSAHISTDQLPQFNVQIVPYYDRISIIIRFSFNPFADDNLQQSLSEYFQLAIKSPTDTNNPLWQVFSILNPIESQIQLRSLTQSTTSSNNNISSGQLGFQIKQQSVTKNTGMLTIHLNTESLPQQSRNQLSQHLNLTVAMKNPYRDFVQSFNGYSIPLQDYKKQVQFEYLNYDQGKKKSIVVSALVWIFLLITLGLIIGTLYLFRSQSRLYIFGSLIEYFQILFLLSFLSVNLPPPIENLFYACRFSAGHLIISSVLNSKLQQDNSSSLMDSPWQFYKYSGDIEMFRNLSDVLLIIGLCLLALLFAWIINKFSIRQFNRKIIKMIINNKLVIFEHLGWLFTPLIGLYSMINVFYGTQTNKFSTTQQQFPLYKICTYLFTICFFLSPIYFFYHQLENKIIFDKGLNMQKKQLGVSIPLYRFIRKFLLVFFITCYWQNSIYGLCIFMLSTAVIFIIVYWFQPYVNSFRQLINVVQQLSLLVLFGEILVLFLNIDFYEWLGVIIVIHAVLHFVLLLGYPMLRVYGWLRFGEDSQRQVERAKGEEDITGSISQGKPKDDDDGKGIEQKDDKVVLENIEIQSEQQTKKPSLNSILRQTAHLNSIGSEFEGDQADESEQGEIVKKKQQEPHIVKLAKKDTHSVIKFKNYNFSSDDDEQQQQQQK